MSYQFKKVLIAPDKFKGSLSSHEICSILKTKIADIAPEIDIVLCPLADGGDGSLEVLKDYLDLRLVEYQTVDPLMRRMISGYFRKGKKAYIELAKATGMALLDIDDQNPMNTSTYGTGLQIEHAITNGCNEVYLFLGGSSTNDAGLGIAKALGYSFLDANGIELDPTGSALCQVEQIVPPKDTLDVKIQLFCDVENPPFGKNGAATIFAKQKGASIQDVELLDQGMNHYCKKIEQYSNIMVSDLKGGGAAGGVAVSLIGLLGAEIRSGMEFISCITSLGAKIRQSDLIISGEGRVDSQSLEGKVLSKIADYCAEYHKPLWLVVGKNDLSEAHMTALGIQKVYALSQFANDDIDPIKKASELMHMVGDFIAQKLTC